LGSALATAFYTLWFAWQRDVLPNTQDFRVGIIFCLAASWFTVPGALLLAAAEFALSKRIRSERAIEWMVVVLGGLVGAAILGGLSLQNAPFDFALLGGFYGLTTAMVFVFLRRLLGFRRERSR
jgi:hypothetical protein